MDPMLIADSTAQGGVFSAAQARMAGFDAEEIRRLRKRGDWITVRRGIYADGAIARTADQDPVSRHLLRLAAARLSLRRPVVASHATAAAILGLTLLDGPPDRVHLTWEGDGSTLAYPQVALHSAALPGDHVAGDATRHWLRHTTPARTVVDIARNEPINTALVVADSALNRQLLTTSDLMTMQQFCDQWPGSRQAARVVRIADGRAESPVETIGRLFAYEQRLPIPDLQVPLGDARGFIGRVDMYWKQHRTVGEIDGKQKYQFSLSPKCRGE